MNRAVLVDGTNIDGFLSKYNVITCKLRNSRIKSKQLGIMEILLSNYDLDIIFIKNGPLSDVDLERKKIFTKKIIYTR